jgi:rRNA biogenesis protein RRP5
VEAYVLAVNERQDNLIDLSIRASRLGNNATPKFTELKDFKSVIPGAIVRGYVKVVNTKNKTAFVSINRNLVARVFFNNLSDTFVKDPVHKFPIGKMVEGRILSVDPKEKHIEMTLKKREVSGKKISFDELEINAKVKGWVKRIEKFGIFITIKRAGIVGLCHLSELSDEKPMTEEEAKKIFSVGDYVKAVILRKNPEKKQVSLSMKPSHFENEEESDDSSDEEKNEIGDDDGEIGDELVSSRKKRKSASNEDDAATPPQKKKKSKEIVPDSESSDDEMAVANDDDSDDDKVVSEDEDDDDAMDVDEESDTPLAKIGKIDFGAKSVLSAPARAANTNAATKSKSADKAKAQQDILVNDEDSEDDLAELASLDSDDEEDKKKPGKGKAAEPEKTKKSAKAEELDELAKERAIEARERAVLEQRPPETPADFERLLVSSPNSSTIWIRFMAFYLFTNELPKAREVAEKALKKIDIREQNEKKNVWVAYMNMENTYGTKESLAAVFRRAVSHSDPENMHLELIKIYTRADNMKAADELYMQLARKWKSSMSVWVRYGIFKFTQGKSDEARLLLDKALKVLPKRDRAYILLFFHDVVFDRLS